MPRHESATDQVNGNSPPHPATTPEATTPRAWTSRSSVRDSDAGSVTSAGAGRAPRTSTRTRRPVVALITHSAIAVDERDAASTGRPTRRVTAGDAPLRAAREGGAPDHRARAAALPHDVGEMAPVSSDRWLPPPADGAHPGAVRRHDLELLSHAGFYGAGPAVCAPRGEVRVAIHRSWVPAAGIHHEQTWFVPVTRGSAGSECDARVRTGEGKAGRRLLRQRLTGINPGIDLSTSEADSRTVESTEGVRSRLT